MIIVEEQKIIRILQNNTHTHTHTHKKKKNKIVAINRTKEEMEGLCVIFILFHL